MSNLSHEQSLTAALRHYYAGEYADAEVLCRQMLSVDSDSLDALYALGSVLGATGRLEEAIATFRHAISVNPTLHSTHNNLGAALVAMRRFDEGLAAYQEAIRLKPDYADAWNNYGVGLLKSGRGEEAFDAYRKAIRFDPHHAAAHNNVGDYLLAIGDVAGAIAAFRESIRLRPDYVDALCNLGIALMEDGAYGDAIGYFERALCVAGDGVAPHWNLACYWLLMGDFARGWVEYEWRWRIGTRSTTRVNYPRPTWAGEDLRGQTILLYTEQGFGDSIQFVRYATLVSRRGGRVILKCLPELAALMKDVEGIEQIVTNDELPEFDVYCPLMTLPLVFATRLESIPAEIPYIRADPQLVEAWGRKLGAPDGRLKVGLVWAGGAGYLNDRKRSLALSQLAVLGQVPNAVFYSLQKGAAAEQIAHHPGAMALIDFSADLNDFSDTAALISQLDLVIAVDTAVAHLAGAMGKPVWLMIPQNPDWRWLLNRDDSPWYPTMRLFRQTRRGDWTEVIERVAGALAGLRASTPSQANTNAPRQMTLADAIALGWQHHQAGRLAEAAGIYREILSQQPQNSDVLHLMGLAAMAAGRPELAAEWIGKAVAIAPAIPDYQHDLGLALSAAGRFAEAAAAYRNVIAVNPAFPESHYNLANALLKSKLYDEAIAAYRHAVTLRSDHADAQLNLGQALAHVSRHTEAVAAFNDAIRLKPNRAEAHMNLGLALMELRQLDNALAATRQAIALDATSADSHWLLAALCLLRGEFAEGWNEYEWRWKRRDSTVLPHQFSQPRWAGERLQGQTILLHAEQGLGDTIQFVRYASLVAERGGRVIVQCPRTLSRLIRTVDGVADVVTPGDACNFDVQCPLLSLPLILQTRLDSIPARVPYFKIDPTDRARWAPGVFNNTLPARRIGLVWAGGANYKDDHKRSMALSQFSRLAMLQNTSFYSLQVGPAASQIREAIDLKLIDFTADLTDFADTAALVSSLDLVISVDTAVAHLAGALGKPVWVLLPYNPDWRWMLDRTDSPWYPTMRLFRQKQRGDWDEVMRRVVEELERGNSDLSKVRGDGK